MLSLCQECKAWTLKSQEQGADCTDLVSSLYDWSPGASLLLCQGVHTSAAERQVLSLVCRNGRKQTSCCSWMRRCWTRRQRICPGAF